ncbi:MAG: GNAT family N-acetyltransferase [Clostridia bacterium]|nr:GNAT family N-acetyltransferase [Clostridia bacterium]
MNIVNDIENIIFEKATIKDIDEIINLYAERMIWFKENGIKQWSKYLSNHPKEQFIQAIEKRNYYILKKDNEIIAGFEISTQSDSWNDNKSNAYYLYKVVSKVGYKNIGNKIFKIAKKITKEKGKDYLRIECLSSNKKLNELYAKHGFEYVKEGKSYYNYTLREYKVNK